MRVQFLTRASALAILVVASAAAVRAQDPADIFRGRVVDMEIGYSPGGGYDLYARTVANFIGNHIPGHPTVVSKNMEGAGSLRLANWLYNAAPKPKIRDEILEDGASLGGMGFPARIGE